MADGAPLRVIEDWEVIYCYKCSVGFAVGASIRKRWLDSGDSFYCPAGHSQHYTESEVQKLKKQLEAEQRSVQFHKNNAAAEREAREATERRLIARKGANTRLRNRIKNGVCPCCTRSFSNLAKHMKSEHPEFQPEETT